MYKKSEKIWMEEDLKLDLETLGTVAGGYEGDFVCAVWNDRYEDIKCDIEIDDRFKSKNDVYHTGYEVMG